DDIELGGASPAVLRVADEDDVRRRLDKGVRRLDPEAQRRRVTAPALSREARRRLLLREAEAPAGNEIIGRLDERDEQRAAFFVGEEQELDREGRRVVDRRVAHVYTDEDFRVINAPQAPVAEKTQAPAPRTPGAAAGAGRAPAPLRPSPAGSRRGAPA